MINKWLDEFAVNRVCRKSLLPIRDRAIIGGAEIDGTIYLHSGSQLVNCKINGKVVADGIESIITNNYFYAKGT